MPRTATGIPPRSSDGASVSAGRDGAVAGAGAPGNGAGLGTTRASSVFAPVVVDAAARRGSSVGSASADSARGDSARGDAARARTAVARGSLSAVARTPIWRINELDGYSRRSQVRSDRALS